MVQVDVFWSFALGAGFAAAAARQLKKADEDEGGLKLLENKYFTKSLIYVACLFAPSGIYLVWRFTGWETMYFWTGHTEPGIYDYERALPAWLVTLFAITNVTQGILGFWWASAYAKRNELFKANLLWIAGYFFMFFILVHGWDGYGYVRFFTRDVAEWNSMFNQSTGVVTHPFGLWMAIRWAFTAEVAWTLYAMGVVLLPLLFYWIGAWAKQGYALADVDQDRARETSSCDLIKIVLRIVFVHTLGAAIVASILIHLLGWIIGAVMFAVVAYVVWLRPGGLARNELSRLTLEEL